MPRWPRHSFCPSLCVGRLVLFLVVCAELLALETIMDWRDSTESSCRENKGQFSTVQSLSRVRLFATPPTAAHQASLSITNSRSPPNPCPLSGWCHPPISSSVTPFSSCPQSFPASGSFQMTLFKESALRIRWPKDWSFSFNISPSNEHPGLISFRMDWLDLSAVQGTLKSLLQHHSSKVSILQCSAFFIIQLSNPHMTTRKTIALSRSTLVYQSNLLNLDSGVTMRDRNQRECQLKGS